MTNQGDGVAAEIAEAVPRRSRYGLKEVFATLQGEGAQAGTPAVFIRFAGCNLGYEVCPWCDTDWAKADHMVDAEETLSLVRGSANDAFGNEHPGLIAVITGGEPSLQFDQPLSGLLRKAGYRIAMESNGSRTVNRDLVDWLTISPKQRDFVQKTGDELKLLFTGTAAPGITPDVAAVREIARDTRFSHYFLQAVDAPGQGPNYAETIQAVMELGPPWRLSVQTHKVIGLR